MWEDLGGWNGLGGQSPHLVNRQRRASNSKNGLDVRCSEGLGYLPYRGVVLR